MKPKKPMVLYTDLNDLCDDLIFAAHGMTPADFCKWYNEGSKLSGRNLDEIKAVRVKVGMNNWKIVKIVR